MAEEFLRIDNLVKSFGTTTVVKNVSLGFDKGEFVTLLGPSGCGKSTTLRMIAGHESTTSGDILLENRNITSLPAAARGTAMMFQSFALFPHLTALDNVAFSLKMKGEDKASRQAKAQALLERVAMGHLLERHLGKSAGFEAPAQALTALNADPVDKDTVYILNVSFSGYGYAWTNVTKKMTFNGGGQASYRYDFQVTEGDHCDIYAYFRPARVDALRFYEPAPFLPGLHAGGDQGLAMLDVRADGGDDHAR